MKLRNVLCIVTICLLTHSYAQKDLSINILNSKIKWFGDYTFHFRGHHGTISFKEGYFVKTDDVISGGEFIIDMNSIVCEDIESKEGKENLVNHLKDPDFFDVSRFPTAKLTITKVVYYEKTKMEIHADLTIKDITNPVSFHAEVDYQKKELVTKFIIDRMKWDITYNSMVRNGAISDGIGFEVSLRI